MQNKYINCNFITHDFIIVIVGILFVIIIKFVLSASPLSQYLLFTDMQYLYVHKPLLIHRLELQCQLINYLVNTILTAAIVLLFFILDIITD